MIIILHLVQTSLPITLLIFSRTAQTDPPDTTPIGSPITGTPLTNRTNMYEFDIGSLTPGDYELHTTGVSGFWVLELGSTSYRIGDSWEELESTSLEITTEYFLNQDPIAEEDELVIYNDEIRTVGIVKASGVFDGDPMTFRIAKEDGTVLATVTPITSTTNTATVQVPAIAKQNCICLTWSLRKVTGNVHVLSGPVIQRYAP